VTRDEVAAMPPEAALVAAIVAATIAAVFAVFQEAWG
jgi:hypothetical protein